MGNIVAIDYGTKRIGLAGGNDKLKIAFPLEVIPSEGNPQEDAKNILKCAKKQFDKIDLIVIGLPLNMDGTESAQSKLSKLLAENISKLTNIPIVFQDERLSSYEAEKRLMEKAGSLKKYLTQKHNQIDAISAAIILEDYFKNQ